MEGQDGGVGNRAARHDHPRIAVEDEMQVPAKEPRLVIAWIEERLGPPVTVNAGRLSRLGQIAAGATQREIA